jgi:protein-S-isoprenylcysteine O-methyltransferase Ste14
MDPRMSILLATNVWCVLHSLLVTGDDAAAPGRLGAWRRLAYNLFAAVTLAPLLLLYLRHPGSPLWAWHGAWQAPRVLLLALAAWLLAGGVRAYDNRTFLGLRQLADARAGRPSPPGLLSRRGVLERVRHPYYGAGLLILACGQDFTTTNVVWRGAFVLYLLVGAALEERRLLRRFGADYADYRRTTPAFLPRPRRSDRTGDCHDVP